MDTINPFKPHLPAPTTARPLLGLTVLAVEDSRFACEALRLLCLRSGRASGVLTACARRGVTFGSIGRPS